MRLKVTPEKHEGSLGSPTHLHLLHYHPKAENTGDIAQKPQAHLTRTLGSNFLRDCVTR